MTLPRPCVDCGTPTRNGTRCPTCTREHNRAQGSATARGYDSRWARQSKRLRQQHLVEHGSVCAGWERDAHRCAPDDLVVDHDVGVLCRSCNASKAAGYDTRRARSRFSENALVTDCRAPRKPVTHPDDGPAVA
jgi:5-methylcytosine-specific restriction protein A